MKYFPCLLIFHKKQSEHMAQFRNIRSCKLDIGFSISIRYFCFLKLPYGIIRKTIGTLHIRKLPNSFRGARKCPLNFTEILHITFK